MEKPGNTEEGASILRRFSTNFAWAIVGEGVSRIGVFAINVYLARVLLVEGFGLFTLAQTITLYFWLAVNLGTGLYGTKEIARRPDSAGEIVRVLTSIRLVVGLLVFVVYITIVAFLDISLTKKLVFGSSAVYLLSFSVYTDWAYRGLERFKYIAVGNTVSFLAYFFGVYFFVHGSGDIAAALLCWAFSYLLAGVTLLYVLKRTFGITIGFVYDRALWLKHLGRSIYYMFSGVARIMTQFIPIMLVGLLATGYGLGLYSASYRLVVTLANAGSLITIAMFPILSDIAHRREEKEMRALVLYYLGGVSVLGGACALVLFLVADPLIHILFTDKYSGSIEVFRLMIWYFPVSLIRNVYGNSLLAMEKQKQHALASFAGLVFILATGPFLLSRYGLQGATVSWLFSEVVIVLSMMAVYYNKKSV